jgi:hypothetical protein
MKRLFHRRGRERQVNYSEADEVDSRIRVQQDR